MRIVGIQWLDNVTWDVIVGGVKGRRWRERERKGDKREGR